ncbi:MAG: cytochrome c biogenesis protein CcdA [Bacteroidales bacterium]
MKHLRNMLVSLMLLLTGSVFSQVLEPVTWKSSTEKISDTEYNLIFTAKIEPKWHLYSQDIPMTPPATTFSFTENKDVELIGKVTESQSVEEYDPNFDVKLKYFSGKAVFTQKVKLLKETAVVKVSIDFMSCDDSKCIPPTEEEFTFKLGETKVATTEVKAELKTDVLPVSETELAPQKEEAKISKVPDNKALVDQGTDITGSKASLWGFFFMAFLGGLAAILTPCVFPMIPMTVSFFMNDKESKFKGKMKAVVYGLSIIAIYTLIGSILAVVAGPDIANWLSTHWLPNILFFIIFIVFAASFFGMFEITMPHWLVNTSDKKADEGGFAGTIFMALTLVLVSFSCTGPIVGTILVESAGGQVLKPIIGMLGFSLAFAMPFTLFAFFPSWLSGLPKSGGWLNSVKVVLGFLELALGLKFLSVADQTYHWGILDREVYLAMWIVIFFLLGLYLLGKIKFAHDSDVKHLSVPRLILAIITFSFVIYLVPGMFGAPLKALSGYMPPMHTHDFDLNAIMRNNARIGGGQAQSSSEICDTPKFHEKLHLPHGLQGYFDYEQALACAKAQNKPLFIDFTGHGCVNCREMEANVWSDPKVLQLLSEQYVVVALYVDDKTELPQNEWVTSAYDQKVKKTIGKKYADFQITKFNVNAQPFYVLMGHKGDVLAQPRAYNLDVDAFVNFLETGVQNFKSGASVSSIPQ